MPMRPLPDGWTAPSLVTDAIVADGLLLHRAGLCATAPTGEEITGSAAGARPDVVERGTFELLERASTLEVIRGRHDVVVRGRDGVATGAVPSEHLFPTSEQPERWRHARSNGVALHATWQDACDRALWELVERDRVLRSWYGEGAPRRVGLDAVALGLTTTSYAWEAHVFDDPGAPAWADGIVAAGVFGFPRAGAGPLAVGYAARTTEADAIAAAAAEAAQLLAFLWGEELPACPPTPGPTPMHHLDHLLWVEGTARLRAWLDGGHRAYGGTAPQAPRAGIPPRFADLTPGWLAGLQVARAFTSDVLPLTFGDAPLAAHLPVDLRMHPIA